MKLKLLASVVAGAVVASSGVFAQAQGYGLHEAIADAIALNPNQEANSLLVTAAQLEASAAQKNSVFPNAHLSMGYGRSISTGTTALTSNSSNAGLSVYKNLYDGGASKHQVKAAELAALTLEAQLRSDDSYVQNTSGELASTVAVDYRMLGFKSAIVFYMDNHIALLTSLLSLNISAGDRELILSQIRSSQTTRIKAQGEVVSAKSALAFRKVKLPTTFDGLEETDNQLRHILRPYMEDVELALETAKKQNQNFIAKKLNLALQEELSAATKAALTRPSVNLVGGVDYGRSTYGNQGYSSSYGWNKHVGINISMPLYMSTSDLLDASRKRVDSAKKLVESEEAKFRHEIISSIASLSALDNVLASYKSNSLEDNKTLTEFANTLRAAGSMNSTETQTIFSLMGNASGNYFNYISELFSNSTRQRFQLESAIGILLNGIESSNGQNSNRR